MMTTPHLGTERASHPVVASAARELLNKSDNERSGVLSTAMSLPWPLPRSDRGAGDARAATGASPTWSTPSGRSRSIWWFRPPTSRRTKPLVRLVLNQIGRRLTEQLRRRRRRAGASCC